MWLFYYFNFERSYDVLRLKSPCILLNKNMNFNKTKRNRKWEIPPSVLERRTACFSWYKNRKLKVKLWWVEARERKKSSFFEPFILSQRNFFKICISPLCIVYWMRFQNIQTFTYQKALLHRLLLLNSKIVESLQCILKNFFDLDRKKLQETQSDVRSFCFTQYLKDRELHWQ